MKKIAWEENGWTVVQHADAKKHILEINCRAEDGQVVEVRVRHNDGEEKKGELYRGNGKVVLPMALKEFQELYLAGDLIIK